jgi:integrase/recombinase XerD
LVRDRAIIELLYSTGMRMSELRGLTLDDVDSANALIFIRDGKGGKDRLVPIGQTALDALRRYVAEARALLALPTCQSLFVTRFGRPVGVYTVGQCLRRSLAAAGLDKHIRVHDLRHTCATHMLDHGADIRYVQELLGHASLSSTQIYTHVSIMRLRETHARHHPRERGAL